MKKTEEEIYIEKGDALYRENLYKEAIAEYNNALKINSSNLVTQLKIAKARLSDNNLKSPADTNNDATRSGGENETGTQSSEEAGSSGLEEKLPVSLNTPAEVPAGNLLRRAKAFVLNLIYMTPALIIFSVAGWYFIITQESRVAPVQPKSTAYNNVVMSPEGASLIFGKKEAPEPAKANEPAKPDTDQKLTSRDRVDAVKKGNADKVSPKKPVTKEKIAKEERVTTGKREAENGEDPGFWAALKRYFLSLFKGTWHQESGDKDLIRDPMGAEKR